MTSFMFEDMSEGLLDDMRVRLTNVRFLLHEFTLGDGAKPCFAFDPVDVENEDNALRTQLYTCGDPKNWAPSDDGMDIIYVGEGDAETAKISKKSGFGFWMKNVAAAGFPASLVKKDDISFFENVEVHLNRLPTGNKREDGSASEKAVPTKFFLKTAGEQKATSKGKGKGKGKAKVEAATTVADNGTAKMPEEFGELIKAAVIEAEAGIDRSSLGAIIRIQKERGIPWQTAAMKLIIKDDVLKGYLETLNLQLADGTIGVKV